jgi:hypothetical protein
MALASTNTFQSFYDQKTLEAARGVATAILGSVVRAPWMSSGLADNNPFTTSLVLRAYGFLFSEELIPDLASSPSPINFLRNWESDLEITDAAGLARELSARSNETSTFLWLSLSDRTRDDINRALAKHLSIDGDLRRRIGVVP